MFQGNWTCSQCGGEIKELPFEPRSNSGLTCRDCYFKSKDSKNASPAEPAITSTEVPSDIPMEAGIASEPQSDDGLAAAPVITGDRKMFEGNWTCSGCGNDITALPFEPRNTENLKCLDCFKASKA